MAITPVLERPDDTRTQPRAEARTEERRVSDAEEHKLHISENYQRILRGDTELAAQSNAPAPAVSAAAQRLSDNLAIAAGLMTRQRMGESTYSSTKVVDFAPVTEQATVTDAPAPAPARAPLFEDISFLNAEPTEMASASYAPVYEPSYAPVREPEIAPVREPAYVPEYDPSYIPSEEDSMPTRETMETLRHMQSAEETGFFAALSKKTKIVLAAVVAAIALLIAIVCINTAVINAINADIASHQQEVERLTQQANDVQSEIDELTDPENIAAWAIEQGMQK